MDISNRNLKYYNKRLETRYKMACQCYIKFDGKMYDAEIIDISNSGIAILLKEYHDSSDIGDVVQFEIYRMNYPVIKMEANVRNVNYVGAFTRIGMQITNGDKVLWDLIVRSAKNGL